ncbi:UDP N acetylglucosamine dolichyl phosphate [Echinococcus multilocularis]|uniref:UDP-N-acetylglucosamine--dolichyl-phosphate N-acetylglucosaminephosphotransferase n=1 Tax=Echinococcus multilocularis TaxID=6211 RepID=A0A068YEJ6_ECHMU|nr:UDP N acetylglucosamine dolichyl phosphate [Echinococcus multilocularis]
MSVEEFPLDKYALELCVISLLSLAGFFITKSLLNSFGQVFIRAGLHGVDMSKPNKPLLPEAQGVIAATVYINCMFLFIPLPFRLHILQSLRWYNPKSSLFIFAQPSLSDTDIIAEQAVLFKTRLIPFLAALLSICCMVFLGFADDVLNLRWRHKLILPTLSSLPLLMVHIANLGTTHIAVPLVLQRFLGTSVDIGFLYYVYMGMLAVFCTNAINIYAGINGLEAGQSIVIALSVICFNIVELSGSEWKAHLFSLYFLLPFTGVTLALLQRNWYPAQLFVGDTFCYFAGMTFSVVCILGHFSKTLMLFFIPQVFNFILSLPQLFRLIPCPRHRLPRFCEQSGLLYPSTVSLHVSSLSPVGRLCLRTLLCVGFTHRSSPDPDCVDLDAKEEADLGETVTIDNLTLINLFLRFSGPISEARTTVTLLGIQILCSCLAFVVRYPMALSLYGQLN